MKMLTFIRVIVALGFGLWGLDTVAGQPTNTPPAGATNALAGRTKKDHGNDDAHGGGRIVHQPGNKPDSDTANLPSDVSSLVQQFQKDRSSFVAQRQQLLLQLKAASKDDRAAIRDQLRDLRDKWSDEQNQIKEEIRDRLNDIKTQLRNQRDEQLGDAGNGGDGHHQKH